MLSDLLAEAEMPCKENDMLIDARLVRAATLAIAVSLLSACAGSPTKESTGEYIDDSVITTKVKTALLRDEQVSTTAIKVETFKGMVQLSGFVATDQEREKAGQLAQSVSGVKEIKNDIRVK